MDETAEKQRVVNRVLKDAGPVEPGTRVRYLVGKGPREDNLIIDPYGQWAVSAKASSTLGGRRGFPGYTAKEATGAPNSWEGPNDPKAWGPAKENAGYEWVELEYARPVYARSVRIRELAGFCVVMVQLRDANGRYHAKWKGKDIGQKTTSWLILDFPETSYLCSAVRITLDTTRAAKWWKQIDSVQLVGTSKKQG